MDIAGAFRPGAYGRRKAAFRFNARILPRRKAAETIGGLMMSGGSMNYIFGRVAEAADMTADKELSELLKDISDVLYAEEWWTSGDTEKTTYDDALARFKAKWFKGNREERLKGYIDEELGRVKKALYALIGESP